MSDHLWRATTAVLASVVVVLTFGLAFTAPKVLTAKNDAVCEAVNRNAATLRTIVGPEPTEFPIPAGADPELVAALEEANRRTVEAWERVQESTRPIRC